MNSNNIDVIAEVPDIHSSSSEYAKRFSGEFGKWALNKQGNAVLKILSKYNNIKTVLDVGGGHGQLTPFLVKKNYDITIYGSSDECKSQVEKFLNNKNCKFEIGSLISLPFEDKAFDAVLCFRQICHLNSWQDATKELMRVSKQIVIIDYPTYKSFNILNKIFFKLKKKIEKNTRTFKIFHDQEIDSVFSQNGFCLGEKIPQFFLPLVFYRIINKKFLCNIFESFFDLFCLRKFFGSPVIIEAKRK